MTARLQRARPGSPELQALVDELAERLGRSVAVDDPLVRMVCTSRHFGDEDPVRIGTLLQGRADNAAIRYVLDQGVTQWSRAGFIDGRDDLGLLPRYVAPLRERGHLLGLLLVVVPEKSLTEHETRAIAQAADVMAAQMHAEHLATDTRKADERDLVLELVGADATARTTARQRGKELGLLGAAEHVQVTVVQLSRATELVRQSETALWGALEGFRQTRSAQGLVAVGTERATLLQLRDRPPGQDEVTAQSARILDALRTFLGPSVHPVIGVGGRHHGLDDAWMSYEQALVAARAARRLPTLKSVGDWELLGELAVLLQLPEHALNASLVPKPLRTLGDSHGGDRLRDTLRSFLEHAGSIPRTADTLGIHRTSLYYRLRQIQEITGLDLDNGAHRLTLHLGLRIEELLSPGGDGAV
ncbi:PucR family transcriptional regulator [Streptomyces candidus]|uniref:Sugar diacid utilization regulator n=1 Tax=Streptomyces candidus TaxID=67283 RepID=A0A7X0HMI6_9ACTN|nr:helix-turn-helix domain-containing protein [Streptomyces candidus]MBB6438878.1 sugar diacid utilization regulator [Streptomyces candidus]GHH52615.1 transcriptional regulator [Streptomyces candidus]